MDLLNSDYDGNGAMSMARLRAGVRIGYAAQADLVEQSQAH
jgi:hypothetical protein